MLVVVYSKMKDDLDCLRSKVLVMKLLISIRCGCECLLISTLKIVEPKRLIRSPRHPQSHGDSKVIMMCMEYLKRKIFIKSLGLNLP